MDANHKRTDYLSWDEYFMGVAMMSGMRSKDPNSQVGACIVSEDNKILSMGYNGFPKGCSDDEFPWMGSGGVFILIAIVAAIIAVAVIFLGVETRGESVENIGDVE